MRERFLKSFVLCLLLFLLISPMLKAAMWVEGSTAYFDSVPNHCNEFPEYDHFLASMGDINGDGLADLTWLSKGDPCHGGDTSFVTSWPGFSINRGTLGTPEWTTS
jgi:hypothetical protein